MTPEEIRSLLKGLVESPGLSGREDPINEHLLRLWEPLVDECRISPLGSLHAIKWGEKAQDGPTLLLAAHMDTIGLMVKRLDRGHIWVTIVGGIDPRVLPGQPVTIHGKEDIPAIIAQPPASALPEGEKSGVVPLKYFHLDPCLPRSIWERRIYVGDPVSFRQETVELKDHRFAGPTLDNRASLAALTAFLQDFQKITHQWNVVAAATTQEEETMAGAWTSGFTLQPEAAIALDVTWARGPGLPEYKTFPPGEGPTNGWGPSIHPKLFELIQKAADRMDLPIAREILPGRSGTDADALQLSGEGIPTGLISIPIQYMHSPLEVVHVKDILRTGRLLIEVAMLLEETDPKTWRSS